MWKRCHALSGSRAATSLRRERACSLPGMVTGSSGVTGFFQVASEQATVDIELSAYDGRPVEIVQRNVGSRPTVPIQVDVPLFTYE